MFIDLDADKDGLLDKAECMVFVSNMEKKGRFPDGVPADIHEQILKMADKDGDQKISYPEFNAWINDGK